MQYSILNYFICELYLIKFKIKWIHKRYVTLIGLIGRNFDIKFFLRNYKLSLTF